MLLTRRSLLASAASAAAFGQEQPPDLANLFPALEAHSRAQRHTLSFLDARWIKLDAWKNAARPKFLEMLRYQPAALPLAGSKVESREQRSGFTLERVTIAATAEYSIPGWFLIPERPRAGNPGVMAIHCHSGRYTWGHEKILSHPDDSAWLTEFRQRTYGGRAYAEELARRGFAVLVTDGFYFGARRLKVEALDPATAPGQMRAKLKDLAAVPRGTREWMMAVDSLCSDFEHLTAKSIFTAGATWPGLLAWDDRRAVDYLASRPEVNRDRIGCLGLSIGGLRTAYLIGSDPRVKAACVMGWMTEFPAQIRNYLRNHTWMVYVPGLFNVMDLADVAALHAPGALLVQQCKQDALFPLAAMEGSVRKLERLYAKAKLPERFRGSFHDVPHSFNVPMQDEAFAWLEKWL